MERHHSWEFIEFLKLLDAAHPADTAIEIILDNHSAHVSRETTAWLVAHPPGRFTFTVTPTHGSWLNLIEGFFSKRARSVLRHIRVSSKHELKERLMDFSMTSIESLSSIAGAIKSITQPKGHRCDN